LLPYIADTGPRHLLNSSASLKWPIRCARRCAPTGWITPICSAGRVAVARRHPPAFLLAVSTAL